MAAAVLFKVRCPSCGKSLRVEAADAGAQMVCRACGSRVEVPAAPLLGPLIADGTAVPVLEAVSARPLAHAPLSDALTQAPLTIKPEAWTFTPAHPEQTLTSQPLAAPEEPDANDLIDLGTDSNLPPWAAAATVPATPPPPADITRSAALPPQVATAPDRARLVPTRMEPADPDEVQVRLGYAAAPAAPVIVKPAALPSAGSPFDPLVDTKVMPAIRDHEADTGPSDEDIRMIQAAHRAGQVHLVERRGRHGHPFWWTALGMLSAAAIVLITLAVTGQVNWFDPWEQKTAPAVAQLKAEAEGLALRGALREAHERYQEIDRLIAGRQIRDPQLRQTVETAREASATVYGLLLKRMSNPAGTAIAEGSAAATPETAVASANPAAAPVTPAPAAPAPVTPAPVTPEVAVAPPAAPNPASTPAGVATRPASQSSPETGRTPEPASRPVEPPAVAVAPPAISLPPARVRPAPRPVIDDNNDGPLTDAEIGKSIQSGVDFLLKQFDEKTHILAARERPDSAYFCGLDALAVYALLQAGQAIDDPRISHRSTEMRARLEALRNLPIDGTHQTYARGLRATALALFNRSEDFKVMAGDVDWLLGTTEGGAYTYDGTYKPLLRRGNFPPGNGTWDNSNSQYGVLGVWSGIDADPRVEVPLAYWKAVARHWTDCQNDDGQWGYGDTRGGGRLSMTCAGIASLFVAHEYLEPPTTSGQVGREPFPPALKKGLEWFERGNNSIRLNGSNWWGYQLYGIERVGLASGFKHFGGHDWYRELAEMVVKRQLGNGSWGDGVVDTSYALLFLSRGRHPIFMNKLRFDGYWSNRPRDVSNMARFAGRQFERPINWQVVNVDNPWTDWTDSPILYIASHEPPKLTDEHLEKLRQFVRAGGMLFTHADAGSPKFDQWARELAGKLFKYELTELPENHSLWSSVYKLTARPQLWGVSNGSRLLMVHSPSDITLKWQQRADRTFESRPDPKKPAALATPDSELKTQMLAPFHFGMNLFVYAAGKRDFRNRLDSAWVTAPEARPIDTVRIARLRYGGNWDPETGSWERYANWFQRATGTRLDVQPMKLADLKSDTALTIPLAHLTGTGRAGFTDNEVAALRAYVEGGGVVLIEPTGGMNAFDNDVRENLLSRTLPDRFPRLLDASHPLMTKSAPGMEDVSKTIVRSYMLERLGGGIGTIQMVTPASADAGKDASGGGRDRPNSGAIVVTSLDLTSGLLGSSAWGILGFQNQYAQNFVKNLVFWTIDGRPQPAADRR